MKTQIPSNVYWKFYQLLEAKAKDSLGKLAVGLSGKELWRVFEEHPVMARNLFRKEKTSRLHFYKKLEELGENDDPIPIDVNLFCDGLYYMGYKLPKPSKGKEPESYPYHDRIEKWGGAFLKKYFAGSPEYLGVLLSGVKKQQIRLDKKVNTALKSRFTSLHNAVFKSEYMQGMLCDRVILKLQVSHPNIVTGICEVLYQEPNYYYPTKTEQLSVKGYFLRGDVVPLIFENLNPKFEHSGVLLLKLDSIGNLNGTFLSHFDKMDPMRKSKIGTLTYERVLYNDEKEIKKFLNELKGKKRITKKRNK